MERPVYPDEWCERFDPDDDHDEPGIDPRTPFAHDRDRIIYSSAFRRLAGKSQVVAASERGDYHTRLTHSLKVAQLGRRVAEQVKLAAHGSIDLETGQFGIRAPDPDLVEAACLAHDLGHPPFGHVAERTLNRGIDGHLDNLNKGDKSWTPAKRHAVGGFEGNAQTFRILSYLSVRRGGHARTGLNLTKATLAATVKYRWLRSDTPDPDDPRAKWGAYGFNDAERLEWAIAPKERKYNHNPTYEAQLMDWCDDVTYAVHDVIDFYRSGHIQLQQLLGFREGRNEFTAEALQFLEQVAVYRDSKEFDERLDYTRDEMLAAWRMVADCCFIDQPWEPKFSVKAAVQKTTGDLITMFVKNVGWSSRGSRYADDFTIGEGLPLLYEGDFVVDGNPVLAKRKRIAVDLLKHLIRFKVIDQRRLASQQIGQEVIIRELLRQSVLRADELLPIDRLEDLKDHGDIVRAASDHVASLAETDAEAMFRRVIGVSLGAFSDVL
jgi:dGTPase